MLANARRFIDATPYSEIEFCEDSMREEFLAMMESGMCIVAEIDGHHLGGVGAVKSPLFFNKKTQVAGERFWWVEPGERAAGVGKALFASLHVAAKKNGCEYLMMLSLADPKTDQLYLKLGFKEVEHCFWSRL